MPDLTPKLVAQEAEAGDALSLEIIAETARYLAVGIVNLMHTIDPNGVLLGGAMTFGGNETALGRQFLGWIKEEVARRAFPVLAETDRHRLRQPRRRRRLHRRRRRGPARIPQVDTCLSGGI